MKEEVTHLVIEAGPERGRAISIPLDGARIGRAENNDIMLLDDSVSSFHCRFSFNESGALWVFDLASTNQTMVNNLPTQEQGLEVGDRIEIGETILLVVHDRLDSSGAPASPAPSPGPGKPAIDLGLNPPVERKRSPLLKMLWVVAMLLFLFAFAGAVMKFSRPATVEAPKEQTTNRRIEISYEKVNADPSNIFRYHLELHDLELRVQINDLENHRHVTKDKTIEQSLANHLADTIDQMEFFGLQQEYSGLSAGVWDSLWLTITLDDQAHTTRVLNRLEPDEFKKVRKELEEFAQNELGLAALALPPEKLLELANDSVLLGQKWFDERDIRYENLFIAIKCFTEAQSFLETIEPKPDYYGTAVSGLEESKRMLQERYDDRIFQAERAIKLRDWNMAAQHLRVICEMIPSRSDDRHQKTKKKLLDVERRLRR